MEYGGPLPVPFLHVNSISPMQFACSGCNQTLKIAQQLPGQTVAIKSSQCGHGFQAQMPRAAATAPEPSFLDTATTVPESSGRPSSGSSVTPGLRFGTDGKPKDASWAKLPVIIAAGCTVNRIADRLDGLVEVWWTWIHR